MTVLEPVRTVPLRRSGAEFGPTLGWGVLEWCSAWLRQPDGPDAGGSWEFTDEQARFILEWYRVNGAGRFVYTRGVYRRPKGHGKSPVVGALALAELCGPVRFSRWEGGEPVGAPVAMAWVQLAGVSEKQTTNTMSMVLAMVNESPLALEAGLDVGLTRIYTTDGGRLEPITASAPTQEGARPTACFEDETHWWTDANGGTKLDAVNRRNLGKSRDGSARCLESTNAHAVGERSVAERSYLAWQAVTDGRSKRSPLLYDAVEAPAETDMSDEVSLTAGLRAAYGDSTWVDFPRLVDEIWDPSTSPEESRRFYLNQIAEASDAWLTDAEIAGAVDATRVVADGDTITLGFDGSRSRAKGVTDSTSLIGCRVSDGHLFELGLWEEPQGPAGEHWSAPVAQIDATVRWAFDTYRVVGFFADPARWESYVTGWEADYGARLTVRVTRDHPVEWWFSGGRVAYTVRATAAFHSALVDRQVTLDGAPGTVRHLLNARRRVSAHGVQIAKEHPESARKIDAAVSCILAFAARQQALVSGAGAPERSRAVYGFAGDAEPGPTSGASAAGTVYGF